MRLSKCVRLFLLVLTPFHIAHGFAVAGDVGNMLQPVNAKDEWKKLKEKISGKEHQSSDESSETSECRPGRDVTVEVRPPNPGFLPEIVVHNKAARPAVAIVKIEQPAGGGKKQTIDVQSVPVLPGKFQVVHYGNSAKVDSCKFVQ